MSFSSENKRIYDLFNRSCYHIPNNQRRYVWNQRNWQELYEDIMLIVNGVETYHFIGSMVLCQEEDRKNGIMHYTIIDGQQRITTLAIMLSSIAFWLKCYSAESEFEGTKQYIVTKDDINKNHVMAPSEFHTSLKAIISRIAEISSDLLKQKTVSAFLKENTIDCRDKNISVAFKYFIEEIRKSAEGSSMDKKAYLGKLIDVVVNRVLYVSIIATSEDDACRVFEILNARGQALADHELLKNFIMRGFQSSGSIDIAKQIWLNIESSLGANINKFVKHYATHRYRTRTQDGFSDYKIIQVNNKGKNTEELLDDLKLKAAYYEKILNPIYFGENKNCSKVEYKVFSFFRKKKHEQIRPVLLSLMHKMDMKILSQAKYEKLILFLHDFFVCYNIIGQENSNKITNTIYKYSKKLEDDFDDNLLNELLLDLCCKLPKKNVFRNAFTAIGWSNHGGFYDDEAGKEKVQTVLEILERHKSHQLILGEFTIEHILDDAKEDISGNIGNLIPLEDSLNQKCNGKNFSQKLDLYSQSSFITARNINQFYKTNHSSLKGEFEEEDILKRAERMAYEFYDDIFKFKEHGNYERLALTTVTSQSNVIREKTIGELTGDNENSKDMEVFNGFEQLTLF